MKIAVLTLYTHEIKDYGILSESNKKKYAQMHGYDFIILKKSLDKKRAPAWSKIKMIQRFLPEYSWIFWTDADSLIMNFNIKLESLINKHSQVSMILTKGVSSSINTGQWLIKNDKWSRTFLDKIWTKTPAYFLKNNPWEQGSFVNLLDEKVKSKIAIVNHRIMNSVPSSKFIDFSCSPRLTTQIAKKITYRPGDFIIHFMFSKNKDKRMEGMKFYSKKVISK